MPLIIQVTLQLTGQSRRNPDESWCRIVAKKLRCKTEVSRLNLASAISSLGDLRQATLSQMQPSISNTKVIRLIYRNNQIIYVKHNEHRRNYVSAKY